MKTWLTLLALILLTVSCGGDIEESKDPFEIKIQQMPIKIRTSEKFDLLNEALLFSAWDDWRIMTGGAVVFVEDPSARLFIEADETVNYGGYSEKSAMIRIDPNLDAEAFRTVALHELGHAAGIPHLEFGLMRPYDGGEFLNCIDDFTLEKVCAAYPCTNQRSSCK